MWSGEVGPFEGKHYRLAETICSPPPVSRPRPKILVGGLGEKKTLRLVARYADACNLFDFLGRDGLAAKLEVLRRHCDAEKRDWAAIEKTSLGTARLGQGESVADVLRRCRELAALGFDQAIFNMPNAHELTPLETFGKEILPEVAAL